MGTEVRPRGPPLRLLLLLLPRLPRPPTAAHGWAPGPKAKGKGLGGDAGSGGCYHTGLARRTSEEGAGRLFPLHRRQSQPAAAEGGVVNAEEPHRAEPSTVE